MKTREITILMLAAIATALSCSKETSPIENSVKMVPMTFTINDENNETKTALGTSNTVNWTSGDQVNIFDDITGKLSTSFDVDATNMKISGAVSEGATKFYSLYPYDAAATISGTVITTTIPTTQYAVAGGFAEDANISVAYTEGTSFTYYNVGALVKFTLSYANVKSVSLSGNNNEKIAGATAITYSVTPTVNMDNGSTVVTLCNKDGSTLTNGADYYFVVAPQTFSTGVTMTFTLSDGSIIKKTSSTSLTLTRNKIKSFGTVTGATAYTSLYEAYQAGATIYIAGIGYNKVNNGNATLLDSATEKDLYTLISGKTGVYFLKGSFTTNSTNSVILSKDIYLISDDPTNPATISDVTSGKNCAIREINFAMKGITLNLANNYFLNNTGTTASIKSIHIDGCTITTSKPILYASSVTNVGVNSIIVQNSKINLNANVVLFNANSCTRMDYYNETIFKNNVMYSSSARNCQILNYANATTQSGITWTGISMSMNNNIFYNIYSGNGLLRQYQVSSLSIGGNIYYDPTSVTTGSRSYYLFSSSQDKTVINNTGDILFGLDASTNWLYSGNTNGEPDGIENTLAKLSATPFTSFDTTTGAYVLNSAYTSYGPQN